MYKVNENLNYAEVFRFMKEYGCDCINENNELIIDLKTNTYTYLGDAPTIEHVKAKVLMSVCRPIYKGLPPRQANQFLRRFNDYFKTELTRDDMGLIYQHLCYGHMIIENVDFIQRGFPMNELKRMSAEGITYADLYNPDNTIHPQSM